MKNINRILIPFDLREDSYNAILHAEFIARSANSEIVLLHLVKNTSDIPFAQNELNKWADRIRESFEGTVKTIVEEGELSTTVDAIAKLQNCGLVVMPTHGMRGMQRITGSLALKVVSESTTPFIVVQQRPIRPEGYKKMVIPVTFRQQLLEEASFFSEMAQLFNSEVYFIAQQVASGNDEELIAKVEEIFSNANIPFSMNIETDQKPFAKSVVAYAATVDADLICAVNFSFEYLYTLFPRTEEEGLIYNEAQIPVLLITPEQKDDSVYFIPMWH
jgi:nucleotide-binding universal stress UspA family protein